MKRYIIAVCAAFVILLGYGFAQPPDNNSRKDFKHGRALIKKGRHEIKIANADARMIRQEMNKGKIGRQLAFHELRKYRLERMQGKIDIRHGRRLMHHKHWKMDQRKN